MGELRHLGRQSQTATDTLDLIPQPDGAPETEVILRCTEFTSVCPVTHQPDFGQLEIAYVPHLALVETKSLKLWLWRYRDRPAFNEALVAEIATAFYAAVAPVAVRVTGTFALRGGIGVTARVVLGEEYPWT